MYLGFSEKLQMLRKEKGLSQEQLAELLCVSRQSISKWESGQTYPEINKLIILSDLFNITLDDLLRDKKIDSIHSEYDNKQEEVEDEFYEDNEDEDEDDDGWLTYGCMMIGSAIGYVTGDFMWMTAGCFLGLGVTEIIKGIKRKI